MAQLTKIHLKNFRCFSEFTLDIKNSTVLIEGLNGSGKTSLLEALHYLCYLRSFRTYSPRELLKFDNDTFFIKVNFKSDIKNELQVGFSGKKKLVKLNKKGISSFKELLDYYRVVTLIEDDLDLIKGGPEGRRLFVDQALCLHDPEFIILIKKLKKIVEQRNALLNSGSVSNELYRLWTQQLWECSHEIQEKRIAVLGFVADSIKKIVTEYFGDQFSLSFEYKPKRLDLSMSFDVFFDSVKKNMLFNELRFGRSLFGAHLDDFSILFQDRKSKNFASRGQQKLIILLIKIAQIKQLINKEGISILLLDDFMGDFDEKRAQILLEILLDLKIQLIFTSPLQDGYLKEKLLLEGAQSIKVDSLNT